MIIAAFCPSSRSLLLPLDFHSPTQHPDHYRLVIVAISALKDEDFWVSKSERIPSLNLHLDSAVKNSQGLSVSLSRSITSIDMGVQRSPPVSVSSIT